MAESPSSTSEKTPNQELGLGLLIPGIKPSDPISTGQVLDIQSPDKPSENGPDGEDNNVIESTTELEFRNAIEREIDEFRNAIEREIYELTIEQAEKETARERLEASSEGKGVSNVETVKKCDLDEGEDCKDEGSFESGNENERGDEESEGNVDGKSGEAVAKWGQYNQGNNQRKVSFPMRPDAEDCAFYMKFGSCKFGMHCKFNHPPGRSKQGVKERSDHWEESSEKAGQTECKYYLTSGGCKYGSSCKYSHEKSSISQIPEFNFLGLPIRPGEKECPYYMRNGSCKYGSNCRFHHPDPTTAGGDSPSGYGNGGSLQSLVPSPTSWSPPRSFNEASPFVPVLFPSRQGAPTSNPEWNGYQAPAYPTPERILPTPPAFALNNLPTDNNFHMRHQHSMVVEEYPERPGEPECSFFLKTGDCKFKSNCKFHHPKNRVSKARANTYTLSDKGLPLRPDQPICTHYHRYGICKYGPACKYDHPSNFAASPQPFDHPPFSNPTIGDGSDNFRRRNQS